MKKSIYECRVYDRNGVPYDGSVAIDCAAYETEELAIAAAREHLKEHPTDIVDVLKQPTFTGDDFDAEPVWCSEEEK